MRVTLSALSLILAGGIFMHVSLAAEAKGKPGVTYRPAGDATLHYNDGVTVHRHSDGSVEVSDPEVREPLYPSQSQPVRRAVRKRAVAHKVAKKATATTTSTSKVTTTKTQHK
jgi:hypothetical protein